MKNMKGSIAMQWSRYNLLFKSKNNGWLLYNSGSNSFIQMSDDVASFTKIVAKNPNVDFSQRPDLFFKLRLGGFLIEDGKDDDLFRILKMRRLLTNYAGNKLLLTIALTKACNFSCPYCYEHNRVPSKMSDETEDKVIQFIEKHNLVNDIIVTWYGGEPLLEFKRMQSLSKKIETLGKKYRADIVTNGYCLTEEVIATLSELKIRIIQITIDGSEKTHDSRRVLIDGRPTYQKIVQNIERLMQSDWEGQLYLRVNVDTSNSDEFVEVYQLFKEKYPDKFGMDIKVYPGFVHDDKNPHSSCNLNSDDKGKFVTKLSRIHGINALSIFPRTKIGGCTLTTKNAYVVGPDGELYKCFHDLGVKEEIVGSVESFINWNTSLIAEGMVGASYLDNRRCEKCFFFPICDGGCPKVRMYNNRDKGKRDTCSYFKNNIKELLEIHYEQKEVYTV